MGQDRGKGKIKEAGGKRWEQNPWEWVETMGAARPPEWTPSPTEMGRGRGGQGLWSGGKTREGGATELEGELNCLRAPTPSWWQSGLE